MLDNMHNSDDAAVIARGEWLRVSRSMTPECRLALAMLEQCWDDLWLPRRETSKDLLFLDALSWVEEQGDRPFSFDWCCYLVRWEPEVFRERFLARARKNSTPRRRFS